MCTTKGKVKMLLCLTNQAMRVYREFGDGIKLILNCSRK
jgi:hypothetical protein